MPFSTFTNLPAESKERKLREAFSKIASRVGEMKWMFKCIWNYYVFVDLYDNTLDLVCNICSFANLLLDDDEIETRPACYHHNHTIGGLDFLYTDLELMVDVLHQSILSHTITDHRNLDTLFELAHAVYTVLKAFQKKYI